MEKLALTISLALDRNQRLVSLVVASVSHARVGAFPEDLRRLSSIAITSSNLSHGGLGSKLVKVFYHLAYSCEYLMILWIPNISPFTFS